MKLITDQKNFLINIRTKFFSVRKLQSSAKGHLVDALASRDDEGRGRLRKFKGSCQHTLILKYPNGETQLFRVTC